MSVEIPGGMQMGNSQESHAIRPMDNIQLAVFKRSQVSQQP